MESGSWVSCPGTQTHHIGFDCWFTTFIYVQARTIPALNAPLATFRTYLKEKLTTTVVLMMVSPCDADVT